MPLHKKRLVKRGYNQASLIAQKLALEFNKVYLSHALVRIRYTPSQGHMSFEQRKKNVSGAFKVHGKFKDKLQGKSVLLIDDVITTGSTINACTKELLKANVKSVCVLAVARTEKT